MNFVKSAKYQLRIFLENRSIPYEIKRARTGTEYWDIPTEQRVIRVRISNHAPATKTTQDYSVHPGSKDTLTKVRYVLRKAFNTG